MGLSITYRIIPEHKLILYRVEGQSSFEALGAFLRALTSDPDYRADYMGVCDWRGAISGLSPEELEVLVKRIEEENVLNNNWVALVDEPVLTAMTMIYQKRVLGTHRSVQVCSTVEKASSIVGMDVGPYLEQL